MRHLNRLLTFSVLTYGLSLQGCSTWNKLDDTERGAVIGGGTGAAVGTAVAPGLGGAVVGGAVGAVTGGVVGNAIQDDKNRSRHRHYDDEH